MYICIDIFVFVHIHKYIHIYIYIPIRVCTYICILHADRKPSACGNFCEADNTSMQPGAANAG